ncbi:uncharacterized protein LOC125220759 [Salvia hispanica]|uniref:uncharacterized protein LOC125220759 n=1 Tax=Salvia hispanica TaxID=49212 RepID=UPI002009C0DE|nr:uncharacterized protein LOC125220759 [Salvia hispanica]
MSNAGGSGEDAEEEFEWQVLEELEAYTTREAERLLERALQPRVPRPRPVVHRRAVTDRDHVAAHQRLYDDYFAEQPRHDVAGRPDHSAIQKCTAAIRQLAYGGAADMWKDYIHIGETTALQCMKFFCHGVIKIFRDRYLRSLTPEDCQDLMRCTGRSMGSRGC